MDGNKLKIMIMKKNKVLILDESKWRCGAASPSKENKRGKGITKLENKEGYMCCLGQFCKQLTPKKDILDFCEPRELNVKISLLATGSRYNIDNTKFSNTAMSINDNEGTSVNQKVSKLRALLKSKGWKLVFKRAKK